MAVDAHLYGTGGETTAALAVFGAGGRVRAAVAGDTRVFARTGSEQWTFPQTRTARLGSGNAVPATYSGVVVLPAYVATDGAWTSGFDELQRSLRVHRTDEAPWIEQQCRLSGDDATLVEVADP